VLKLKINILLHVSMKLCHSQAVCMYQQMLQCTAVLLQDRSEKKQTRLVQLLFDTLCCKLGTDCYKLHSEVELPSYVTCYIAIN
jgi:hypothetical protein